MLASVLYLDLSPLLQFVITALVLALGLLYIVKATASRYFVVDARFDEGAIAAVADDHPMPNGSGFADLRPMPAAGGDACFVCGSSASKKCSRCKTVRYCSTTCQAKHWKEEHKLKCEDFNLLDKVDSLPSPSPSSACGRRKASLVPSYGTCKVLQQPKKVLFPYDEFVKLFNWHTSGFPPCGLLNCGNSCFANVVLQCLACTRPLVAFLLEKEHSRKCNRNDWCFLCELQSHIDRVSQSLHPFSPINILSRLPNIGGNLGYGKQEDAHEFMRFAIDTMQSICLDEFGGEKALDPSSQETTLIQHIFRGRLQSEVICTKCDQISYRYESMMDLTVEIQGDVACLEDCLDQFTVKEWLDGDNMYKCDGCNDYVKAWKRLTIHQAPNILTIALKRFQSGRFGKLNKRVTFPETLDLGSYMSEAGDGTDVYKLYAVVVHVDMLNASFFGHYICYTKDFSGNWYRIDDCKVMKVELEEVLAQGAYMLLYSRICAWQPQVKSQEHLRKAAETQSVEVAKEVQGSRELVESLDIAVSENSVSAPDCLSSNTGWQSMDSEYEREISIKFDSRNQDEPEFQNVVDPIKVASKPTREDPDGAGLCCPQLSSPGSKDLDKSSLAYCSHVVEDVPSVELTHGEPTNSVSAIELSIKAAAVNCQEPGIISVDCQGNEENGTWNNRDKEYQLVESSSDDYITNEMAETSGISIAALSLAQNSGELVSHSFSPSYSEYRSEQVVTSCYPSISGNGLGDSNCNGFVESGSAQNSSLINGCDANSNCNGFVESGSAQNKSMINGCDAYLETFYEKCEDLTDSGNLSITPRSFDKPSRKSSNEDEPARKRPGTVEHACNGCVHPLYSDEKGRRVVSHDVSVMTFCRNCEDMPLDFKKPPNYDDNAQNAAEVARSYKLDTNCNGFINSVITDQNVGRIYEEDENGNDVILDCKGPLISYLHDESSRENFHEKSEVAPKQNDPVEVGGNASDLHVNHNGNGDKSCDIGLLPLWENDKDVHLNCKGQRQETV